MKRREFITLLGGAAVASAKSDPVAAGDGAVSVMERIWPAFQDIDTSSGALGTAGGRTLDELIPILVEASNFERPRAYSKNVTPKYRPKRQSAGILLPAPVSDT